MNHIYSCKYLNKKEETLPFEKIYQGNIKQQVKVFKRFVENFEIRQKILEEKEGENKEVKNGNKRKRKLEKKKEI